ncbi:HNH endonuclease [Herbaspirillum rubrisubalbicans Os34]|uniref:HNH endonuclease n=1 Tax=Herbaspirillum rubrisubalbicans Os34 TaxID=1235827 RepID=A0A6M3ZXM8_9BURK|nr:HNH endonuclease [Herbaspirillum rubrisubalbicans]QJQ03435.1 HNH endonuclease [Herbaspirillum rubrisubalbicans Os34]
MNRFAPLEWTNQDNELLANVRNLSFTDGWSTDHAEVQAFRNRMLHLQRWRCAYCRAPIENNANGYRELDHIVPKAANGALPRRLVSNEFKDRRVTPGYPHLMYEPMNLALACKLCNTAKGSFDAYMDRSRPQKPKYPNQENFTEEICWYNPHFHAYHEHIEKTLNCNFIQKSPHGDFTIRACKLDDAEQLKKIFQSRALALAGRADSLKELLNSLAAAVESAVIGPDQANQVLRDELGIPAAKAEPLFARWYDSHMERTSMPKLAKAQAAYTDVVGNIDENGGLDAVEHVSEIFHRWMAARQG